MRSFFTRFMFLLCGVLFSINCFAWAPVGHEIIANIAYARLQAPVRAKVDAMLTDFSKEYPDITTFAQMATWADSLRGQKIELFTHWHYYNAAFSDDGTPLKNMVDSDNAMWALQEIEPVLKNDQANRFEKARLLAFFIHIVGDLHQPLHTTVRLSKEHPYGDEGGNMYPIQYQTKDMQYTNLHALWDYGMGIFDDNLSTDDITALTNTITTLYPESSFGAQIQDLNIQNWLNEGMTITKASVYTTPENQTPGQDYLNAGTKISEQRVALAGYRLAALLNQLLA